VIEDNQIGMDNEGMYEEAEPLAAPTPPRRIRLDPDALAFQFSSSIRENASEIAADNEYEQAGFFGKVGIGISDYWGRTTEMLGEGMRFSYDVLPAIYAESAIDLYEEFTGIEGLVPANIRQEIVDTALNAEGFKSMAQVGRDKGLVKQTVEPSAFRDSYLNPDAVGGIASSVALGAGAIFIPGAQFVAVPLMGTMAMDAVFGEYAEAIATNPEMEYDWKVGAGLGLLVSLEMVGTKFGTIDLPKMMASWAFKKGIKESAKGKVKKGLGKVMLGELAAAGFEGLEELTEEQLEGLVQLMYLPEHESFRKAVLSGEMGFEQWATVGKIMSDNFEWRTILLGAMGYTGSRSAAGIQQAAQRRDFENQLSGVEITEEAIAEIKAPPAAPEPIGESAEEVSPDDVGPAETPPSIKDLTDDQMGALATRLVEANPEGVARLLRTSKGRDRKSGRQLALWEGILPPDVVTNQATRQRLFDAIKAAEAAKGTAPGPEAPIGEPEAPEAPAAPVVEPEAPEAAAPEAGSLEAMRARRREIRESLGLTPDPEGSGLLDIEALEAAPEELRNELFQLDDDIDTAEFAEGTAEMDREAAAGDTGVIEIEVSEAGVDELSMERMSILEDIERREQELGDVDPTTDDEYMSLQQELARVDRELAAGESTDTEFSTDVPASQGPIQSSDLDVQSGTQMGSMPGGVAVSKSNGKRYYVKRYENKEQVRNEKVANAFYQAAGVRVPEVTYVVENGQIVGVASVMIDGLTEGGNPRGAGAGFIMDSWLANWDVVGMDGDNLLTDSDGNAVRVDQGGALTTRAQGEPKGSRFGNEVTETTRLREKNEVFSRVSPADMRNGLDSLESISESDIARIVRENSTGDTEADNQLIKTLIARRSDLLSKRAELVDQSEVEFSEDTEALEADAELSAINVDGREFERLADEDVSEQERQLAERVRAKTGKTVKFVRQISGPTTNGWFLQSSPDTLTIVSREYDSAAIAKKIGKDAVSALEKKLAQVERAIKRGGSTTTTETDSKGKTTKKVTPAKSKLKKQRAKIKAEIKRRKKVTEKTVDQAYEDMLLQTVIHENYHSIDPTSTTSEEDERLRGMTHKILISALNNGGMSRRLGMPITTYRREIEAAKTDEEVRAAENKLNRELRAEAVSDMAVLQLSGVTEAFYDRGFMTKVRSRVRKLSKAFGSSKDSQTLNRIMLNTDAGNFRVGSYAGAMSTRAIVNSSIEELYGIADVAPMTRRSSLPSTGGDRPEMMRPMEFSVEPESALPYTTKEPGQYEFEVGPGLKIRARIGMNPESASLTFSSEFLSVPMIIDSRDRRFDFTRRTTSIPTNVINQGRNRQRTARRDGLGPITEKISTYDMVKPDINPGIVLATVAKIATDHVLKYKIKDLNFSASGTSEQYIPAVSPEVSAALDILSMLEGAKAPGTIGRVTSGEAVNLMRGEDGKGYPSEALRGGIGRGVSTPSINLRTTYIKQLYDANNPKGTSRGAVYSRIAKRIATALDYEVIEDSPAQQKKLLRKRKKDLQASLRKLENDVQAMEGDSSAENAALIKRKGELEARLRKLPKKVAPSRMRKIKEEIAEIDQALEKGESVFSGLASKKRKEIEEELSDIKEKMDGLRERTSNFNVRRRRTEEEKAEEKRLEQEAREGRERRQREDDERDAARRAMPTGDVEELVSHAAAYNISAIRLANREIKRGAARMVADYFNLYDNQGSLEAMAITHRQVVRDFEGSPEELAAEEELHEAAEQNLENELQNSLQDNAARLRLLTETYYLMDGEPVPSSGRTNATRLQDKIGKLAILQLRIQAGRNEDTAQEILDVSDARSISRQMVVAGLSEEVQSDLNRALSFRGAAGINRRLRDSLRDFDATSSGSTSSDAGVDRLHEMVLEHLEIVIPHESLDFDTDRRLIDAMAKAAVSEGLLETREEAIDIISAGREQAGLDEIDMDARRSTEPVSMPRRQPGEYIDPFIEEILREPNAGSADFSQDVAPILRPEHLGDPVMSGIVGEVPYIDAIRTIQNPTRENILELFAMRRAFGSKGLAKGQTEWAKVPEEEVRSAIGQLGIEPSDEVVKYISDFYYEFVGMGQSVELALGKDEQFSSRGKVERAMAELFDRNPSPTAAELSEIEGAPKVGTGVVKTGLKGNLSPRRVKTFIDNALSTVVKADGAVATTEDIEQIESLLESNDVVIYVGEGTPTIHAKREWLNRFRKPVDYAKIKAMTIEAMKAGYHNWYREFGEFFYGIGGPDLVNEAAMVFGVTSSQSPVEQNISDTLHIMLLARQYRESGQPWNVKSFVDWAMSQPKRSNPNTLKGTLGMFVSGKQMTQIAKFYIDGTPADGKGAIKTRTYSGQIAEAAHNNFYPWSVQDRHQAALYGFLSGSFNEVNGKFTYDKVFPLDSDYRYAQYLTMRLSMEPELLGNTPSMIQAGQWFHTKAGESPYPELDTKENKGMVANFEKNHPELRSGTFRSAEVFSSEEIARLKAMLADKSVSQETADLGRNLLVPGYTHFAYGAAQMSQGQHMARKLAKHMREGGARVNLFGIPSISAPGVSRQLTMDESAMYEFYSQIVDTATESDGSIGILNSMGLPHTPMVSLAGSVDGRPYIGFQFTPLVGSISDPATASLVGALMGVGTMQPRMATVQPSPTGTAMTVRVYVGDQSKMSQEQTEAVMSRMSALKSNGEVSQSVAPANGYVEVTIDPGSKKIDADKVISQFNKIAEEIQNEEGITVRGEAHRTEVQVIDQSQYVGIIESSGTAASEGPDLLSRVLGEVATPVVAILQANDFNFNRQEFAEGLGIDPDVASVIPQVEFSSDSSFPDVAEQREALVNESGGVIVADQPGVLAESAAKEARWWSSLEREEQEIIAMWVNGHTVPQGRGEFTPSDPDVAHAFEQFEMAFPHTEAYSAIRAIVTQKYGSWQAGRVFASNLPVDMTKFDDYPYEGEVGVPEAIERGLQNGLRDVWTTGPRPKAMSWFTELFIDSDGRYLEPEIRYIRDVGTFGVIGVAYNGDASSWAEGSIVNYDGQNYVIIGTPEGQDNGDNATVTTADIISAIFGTLVGQDTALKRLQATAFPEGASQDVIDSMEVTELGAKIYDVPRGITKRQPWQLGEIRTKVARAMYHELRGVEDSMENMVEEALAPLYRKFLSGMSSAPRVESAVAYRAVNSILPEAFTRRFSEGDVFRIEAPASMTIDASVAAGFSATQGGGMRDALAQGQMIKTRGERKALTQEYRQVTAQSPTIQFVVDNVSTARAVGLGSLRGIVSKDRVMDMTRRVGLSEASPDLAGARDQESRTLDVNRGGQFEGMVVPMDNPDSDQRLAMAQGRIYDNSGRSRLADSLSKDDFATKEEFLATRFEAEVISFTQAVDALVAEGTVTAEQAAEIKENATDPDNFIVPPSIAEQEVLAMPGSAYRVERIESDGNLVVLTEVRLSEAELSDTPVLAEFSEDVATDDLLGSEPESFDTVQSVRFRQGMVIKGRRYAQDRFIQLDYVQRDLADAFGQELDIEEDALNQFRNIPGILNHHAERFKEKHAEPLASDVARAGLSQSEFGEYAVAMHALDVNKDLRGRNAAALAGEIDSGMTDEQAMEVINRMIGRAAAGEVDLKEIEFLRRRLVQMSRATMRKAKNSGLITETEFDRLSERFPNYVPMWNAFEEATDEANSEREQFVVPANVLMARTGRTAGSLAGDEAFFADRIAAVADQRFRVLRKAAANEALKRLLRLTNTANNSNILSVFKPGVKRFSNSKTGEIGVMADDSWRNDPTVFTVMVGGQRVLLKINDKGLAEAIKNKSMPKGTVHQKLFQTASLFTSTFRFLTTQFGNPDFTAVNPVRDVQQATASVVGENQSLSSQTEDGSFKKLSVTKRLKIVMRAGLNIAVALPVTFGLGTEGMRTSYAKYRALGGRQGFFMDQDPVRARKSLKAATSGGTVSRYGRARVVKVAKSPAWLWGKVNTMFDDGIRFAVWHRLVAEGVNPQKAIETTRDLTVDFSRMGTGGPYVNAMYAYANAGVQGTTKTARLMKSKAGASVVGGYILAGMMSELLGDDGEDRDENGISDWEEIPQYERDANMHIRIPFGDDDDKAGYIAVPVAYGLDVPFVLGRRLVRMGKGMGIFGSNPNGQGTDTVGEGVLAVLSASVTQFVPTGANALVEPGDDPLRNTVHGALRLGLPDILDPIVDLGMNKDWRNQSIYNQPFPTDPAPNRSRMGRRGDQGYETSPSTAWANDLVKLMNDVTGGNEVVAGGVSIQPEWITYSLQALFGGTYKTAARAIDGIANSIHNNYLRDNFPDEPDLVKETEIKDIPVLRRFYTESPRPDVMRRRFYDSRDAVFRSDAEVRKQEEAGMFDEADAQYEREYPLIDAVEIYKDERKVRSAIRKMAKEMKADGFSRAEILIEKKRMMAEVEELQREAVTQIMEDKRAKAEAESN